jgi:hypothetical protein
MSPHHANPCRTINFYAMPMLWIPAAFDSSKSTTDPGDKMMPKGERKLFRSAVTTIAVNLPSALINRYKKTKK